MGIQATTPSARTSCQVGAKLHRALSPMPTKLSKIKNSPLYLPKIFTKYIDDTHTLHIYLTVSLSLPTTKNTLSQKHT